jgi:predicted Zn-dependent protease
MWQQMERVEEEIAGSNLLIKDPAADRLSARLIGKVGGPAAKDMRIYLARIPEFNAMMFPTGFAVVFSGLLLRMRNEAQLAGVIAHESGHFLRRTRSASGATCGARPTFSRSARWGRGRGAAAGVYTGDIVQLAQLGTILSLFRYSREMEAEADAMGAAARRAGYDPIEMAKTWQQLIGEDASAKYRRKRRDRDIAVRHPPVARIAHGRPQALGAEVTRPGKLRRRAPLSRGDRRDPADAARRPGQAQRPGRQPISRSRRWPGRLERPAALLRGRGLAAAQPRRRRCFARAGLCRRGRLSRRAGRRLALARTRQ